MTEFPIPEIKLKKCNLCGKVIVNYEVLHINIAQNIKIHYFCNKTCKTAWLLKQIKQSPVAFKKEKFTGSKTFQDPWYWKK